MSKKTKELVSFNEIVQASNGDEQALQNILRHYEAYTAKLCTRPLYDLEGIVHMVVDDEMKGRLQSALLDAISKFNATTTV